MMMMMMMDCCRQLILAEKAKHHRSRCPNPSVRRNPLPGAVASHTREGPEHAPPPRSLPLAMLTTIRVGADPDRLGVDPAGEQLAAQLVQPSLRVDPIADASGRPRPLGDRGGAGPGPGDKVGRVDEFGPVVGLNPGNLVRRLRCRAPGKVRWLDLAGCVWGASASGGAISGAPV